MQSRYFYDIYRMCMHDYMYMYNMYNDTHISL
jgi:hypothetical protein